MTKKFSWSTKDQKRWETPEEGKWENYSARCQDLEKVMIIKVMDTDEETNKSTEQVKVQKPIYTFLETWYMTELPLKINGESTGDPINGAGIICYPYEIVFVPDTIYTHISDELKT